MESKIAHKKANILILHSYMAPYRIDIYNTLAAEFNVLVLYWFLVCPDQNFDQNQMKSRVKFRFKYLHWGGGIKSRIVKLDIIYYLFKFRPTIVLAHEYGFFTLVTIAISKLLRYKVIINCDDSSAMIANQSKFKASLKRFCINNSAGLITVSEKVKAAYVSLGIPENKIIAHQIMHDDVSFRQALVAALPISEEYLDTYGLRGKKIILFVGRLVHVKAIDILFKSFKQLIAIDSSLVIVLVGEGEELINLQLMAKQLNIFDSVKFVGRFDGERLKAWYNVGSVFVLASRFEPFGAVVNEALVSGIPVICSSVAGASILINDTNGAIVVPDDEKDLCNKINYVASKVVIPHMLYVRKSLMLLTYLQNSNDLIAFLSSIMD